MDNALIKVNVYVIKDTLEKIVLNRFKSTQARWINRI
jgi:hypothetical protein